MTLKPTLDEYKQIGEELSILCAHLSRLSCRLGNETGITKDPYKYAAEAARNLDKCKSAAEDLMFSHYPDLGREAVNIFYRPVYTSFEEPTEVNLKEGWQFK